MSQDVDEKVAQKPVEVDLNSLDLVDEQVSINQDADAFAGPPPPDDGDHRVKLQLAPKGVTQGRTDKGVPYYMIKMRADCQPGDPFEGRVMFTMVSSLVMQGTGTSKMVGVLKALGEHVNARESILELSRRLKARLDGEPEVLVQTQWTAYCADCKESGKKKGGIVLRGQKRFPENADGTHRHQVECPNCGSLLTAQADIVAIKPAV